MSETFLRSMRIGGKVIGLPSMNCPSVKSIRSTDQPHSLSVRRTHRSGTIPNTIRNSMNTNAAPSIASPQEVGRSIGLRCPYAMMPQTIRPVIRIDVTSATTSPPVWCVLSVRAKRIRRDLPEAHPVQTHGMNLRSNLPEQRPDRSTF